MLAKLNGINHAEVYVEKLIKAYPRYARDQLRILDKCTQSYSGDELQHALKYCVDRNLISANDFRDTLEFLRSEEPEIITAELKLPEKYLMIQPKTRCIKSYLPDTWFILMNRENIELAKVFI